MTIRDVAKRAGVSIATVSRVLNGSERVSVEAKQAVELAMTELNYQKPPEKRKKPTKLFAVIVRNMSNPFFSQLVDVLEEEAYKHGRSLLLFNSRNNLQLEKTFFSECINHKVDGVFLIPRSLKQEHLTYLNDLPFPVVLLTATAPNTISIGTHHQHGGELAAKYFVQQGYRKLGYLGASDTKSDRLLGYQNELFRLGKELPTESVLAPYDSDSLRDYIEKWISHHPQPIEAVFCSDDISASHLHNALQEQKVSHKVDIIGFDDTFIAQSLGFSSIRQPIRKIALLGFDMMIEAIQQGELAQRLVLLEPTLSVRSHPSLQAVSRRPEILRND
ncbi:transcriptional regulator, LacI family protein [Vibrio orientalis CIP 102891 = ATCC 33934]|uniref:Transcriptional regulator LacI family n=1 Tax=Vibrio orientalis CIP 102891 = ATCC 33934 TaxID=675816 RepID=C9QL38_VIBOR|nr:LacI family DNA-binding transcriptional regulator [Vibrio orientalis]EEX91516.1 transcriptional regulator LacI family [Vibrio orientalis CIP 102891 = ATCC 33934]EGU47385.1 transcriptional regulator, LacI family protein [Vibrio orientalis CIP 102891 = ATCC 33934]